MPNTWGPLLHEYWGFVPCIELCVCHYRLGNIEEAIKYNNMAAEHDPNHPSVLQNKRSFENMQKNKKDSNQSV
jgi:hypothetical protein